jgi:hypothetical protein
MDCKETVEKLFNSDTNEISEMIRSNKAQLLRIEKLFIKKNCSYFYYSDAHNICQNYVNTLQRNLIGSNIIINEIYSDPIKCVFKAAKIPLKTTTIIEMVTQ